MGLSVFSTRRRILSFDPDSEGRRRNSNDPNLPVDRRPFNKSLQHFVDNAIVVVGVLRETLV